LFIRNEARSLELDLAAAKDDSRASASLAQKLETEAVRRRDLEGEVLALRGTKDASLEKALEAERAKTAELERSLAEARAAPPPPRDESALERRVADLERLEAALMLRVEQEQTAARENQKRLVNALRENSELRARLSDSSASVRRTVLLEDIEDSDSLAPVPAPPPRRRRRSSSASLFGDEDPISSLRGRSAVPRSPRRRSASGSSFVDVGPGHKTRAPRSAARTPRRRGTPTIDDYYAKYSRSTAERLYAHDTATRRTFDEAARHAEALFAAHDMSPARD
jgi:hypothetical protein